MRRTILSILLAFSAVCAAAQRETVREEVLADWNLSSGLDCVYDLSPKALTPAPKGYQASYISHYGRHGSRYAYTEKAYKVLLDMLRDGASEGNLTDYGFALLANLEKFWDRARFQVGDLTELGWKQHKFIAETMVKNFPKAFGKGSRVDACSSPSQRSIISMASCVSAIAAAAPKTEVYAHQSTLDIQATRPNLGPNPFRYTGPEFTFPYEESSKEFFLRKFPNYNDVLGRLFKKPEKSLRGRDVWKVFFNLYMFVAGMNSLNAQDRVPTKGFFTKEEYATLWETDNYERYREYLAYRTSCSSIVEDIVTKADARLSGGSRGADLRFGHDHVVMGLLTLMDIENFGHIPEKADDVVKYFQSFRSPMAANLQFVFYTPKGCTKGREPLVKLLLNGEEARIGALETLQGPYYKWSEVKSYLLGRVALFVTDRPKP